MSPVKNEKLPKPKTVSEFLARVREEDSQSRFRREPVPSENELLRTLSKPVPDNPEFVKILDAAARLHQRESERVAEVVGRLSRGRGSPFTPKEPHTR